MSISGIRGHKYRYRDKGAPKVVRGGGWKDDIGEMRVSARGPIDRNKGEEGVGFRLVLMEKQEMYLALGK
ncbi:hypothetical protein ACFL7M_14220 [Thermodesulfobacteriota bacterium]